MIRRNWTARDRIVWSTGHKAPSLYLGLAFAGFCPLDDVVTLRKLSSPYQGHPHWLKLPGVEASTGSLGQGLSIAVGLALAARLDERKHKIFCIMGDGEQQEIELLQGVRQAVQEAACLPAFLWRHRRLAMPPMVVIFQEKGAKTSVQLIERQCRSRTPAPRRRVPRKRTEEELIDRLEEALDPTTAAWLTREGKDQRHLQIDPDLFHVG